MVHHNACSPLPCLGDQSLGLDNTQRRPHGRFRDVEFRGETEHARKLPLQTTASNSFAQSPGNLLNNSGTVQGRCHGRSKRFFPKCTGRVQPLTVA